MTLLFEAIQKSENADCKSMAGNKMTEESGTRKLKVRGPNSLRGT